MSLKEYHRKRDFKATPEPRGEEIDRTGELRFVVQMHEATRAHYDFRIEMDGVFKSWAIPKGPSLNPNDQRLAVYVEDHPIAYGGFEGIIPKGNYGAGTVMIWDAGTFYERSAKTPEESIKNLLAGLADGHITIVLSGRKIAGEFALIKIKEGDQKTWLLVKKRDEYASYAHDVTQQNRSVASGRTMREITEQSKAHDAIWLPGKGIKDPKKLNDFLYYTGERLQPNPEKKAAPPQQVHEATVSALEDARDERMPRKNKPMLPQMAGKLFSDQDWIYDMSWNGFRALAEIEGPRVSFYSRQGLDYRKKFPEIMRALQKLKIHAVLDGEIVMLNTKGQPNVQLPDHKETNGTPALLVHDILHLDGKNLRDLPLHIRRKTLKHLHLAVAAPAVQLIPEAHGSIDDIEKAAVAAGAPALIAKHRLSPYTPGTNNAWIHVDLTGETQVNTPRITHPEKIYFPAGQITKGNVIAYYEAIADVILPHLRDRPESLNRHPNGITGESFFQKDMVGHLPPYVSSHPVYSESSEKSINYILCQNKETLLYMANLGCIELNPWLARVPNLDLPDYSVIDLDPDEHDYSQVVLVAQTVRRVLDEVGAISYVKTSGSSGMHILVPSGARFSYEVTRAFAEEVCRIVNRQLPKLTSIERNPSRRRGKIYLDFMQNRRGQTLAAPYCLRPRPLATASAPLHWDEVVKDLRPEAFTIGTMQKRISEVGDLWRDIITQEVDLESLTERVRLMDV